MLVALISLIVALLDTTWTPVFSVGGVVPDLVLVWVVSLIILLPDRAAVHFFMMGLLKDLLVGEVLGRHALALLLVGFVLTFINGRLFKGQLLNALLLLLVAEAIFDSLVSWQLVLAWELGEFIYSYVLLLLVMGIISKLKGVEDVSWVQV